jgi:hypothetical protein
MSGFSWSEEMAAIGQTSLRMRIIGKHNMFIEGRYTINEYKRRKNDDSFPIQCLFAFKGTRIGICTMNNIDLFYHMYDSFI